MKNNLYFGISQVSKKSAVVVLAAILLVVSGFFAPNNALAVGGVAVNPATGAENISIDTTSSTDGTGAFTELSGPSLMETTPGGISAISHTISLPVGWEFDTSSSITVMKFGSNLMPASQTVVPSADSFTFIVTTPSTNGNATLGFSGIKIRPTGTTPSTGNMTYLGAGIAGVDGATNFGTLTTVAGAPTQLKIEDSAAGGAEIDTANVISGATLTAYSNTHDQFNNFVANVAATWSLVGFTGGVADGNLVPAGDNKSAVFTGNLVGTTVAQASGGVGGDTTGVITVAPGPVSASNSTVAVDSSGTAVVSGGANVITVTVTAKDAVGNPIPDKVASIVSSGTGDSISPATASTNLSGVATFTISSTKAEAKTITATVDGVEITSSTPGVTFTHGPASQLAIQAAPSGTATAGEAFAQQPVVEILDQFGNLVNDDNTTVITAARGSTGIDSLKSTGSLTAIATGGVATFSGLNYEKAESMTIAFSSGSLTPITSDPITVSPNVPDAVTFTTQPASTGTVDVILTTQPVVSVIDAYGNNVADGTSVTLSLTTGTGALRETLTKTTSGGTATFDDIGYNKVDAFSITATAGSASATSASVGPLSAGIINSFTLSAVTSQVAGVAFSVSVSGAVDQYGNAASGTVDISASTGGGDSPSTDTPTYGPIDVTNGSGSANSTLVNAVDTVLRGTVGSVTSDTDTITVSANDPSQVTLSSDKININANGTDTATLTAQLKDMYGNSSPTSGIDVNFSSPRGSIIDIPVSTNGSGQAVATFNSGTDENSGNVTVTTSSGVLDSGTVIITFNDVTAPAAPTISTPSSSSEVINIANKSSQTLSGTAEIGSTVEIYVGGVATGVTTTADGSGNFAFTNEQLQAADIASDTDYSDAKSVTVTATDAAGNESSESDPISYTQDTVAPTISTYDKTNTTFSPDGDGSKDTTSFDLAFSEASVVYDINILNSSAIKVKDLANGTAQDPLLKTWDGTDNTDVTVVADGTYTVQVIMTDPAGNSTTDVSYNDLTVDTVFPTVALTYSADQAKAGTETITATYNEPIVGTPQISIDQPGTMDIGPVDMTVTEGSDSKIWTYEYTVHTADGGAYVDGEATISLSAVVDAAGNTAGAPSGDTFTIDTTAPSIDGVAAPVADAVYTTSVPVQFTPNDTGSGAVTCAYAINDDDSSSFGCTKGEAVDTSIQVSDFVDGRNTITLTVTDAAGNLISATSDSFVVNTNQILTVGATDSDFTTIQEAIDKATSGNTISVSAGTYVEDLLIEKTIELSGADKTTTTIKGIANAPVASAPLAVPNIDIQADDVKVHGFTIAGPDYVSGTYVSGMLIDGTNVEIYGNNFAATAAEATDELTHAVMTYSTGAIPTADVSRLNIHDNTFTGFGATGLEAIYINPHSGSGNITIDNNQISGAINIGITVESGNATVSNNSVSSTLNQETLPYGTYGIRFFDSTYAGTYDNIVISGNSVQNFKRGIRIGNGGAGDSTITANIESNTLAGNSIGIWARQYGASVTATGNLMSGNTTTAVQNDDGTSTVSAGSNWWGQSTGPTVASNTTGTGDAIVGSVDYRPWCVEETCATMDTTPPTVEVSTTAGDPTNLATIPIHIVFSEAVSDFTADDITVTNGSKGSLNGSGDDYTINVTPTDAGEVTVKVNANAAWDVSGNYNTVSNTASVTYDNVIPTLSSVSIASDNDDDTLAKVGDTVTLSFTASEDINQPVVTIAGHALLDSAVTGSGTDWTATYAMDAGDTEGTVPFTIGFTDVAGNDGATVTDVTDDTSVTFDKTAPAVGLTSIAGDNYINNSEKAAIHVVGTAEAGSTVDVSLTSEATVTGSATADDGTFDITIDGTTLTDGTVTPSVTATDAAGTVSESVTSPTATKDVSAPSVTSKTPSAGAVGIDPTGNITVVFNEDVVITNDQVTVQKGSDTPVSTAVEFDADTNTATIDPSTTLDNNSKYTVTLTGVTDTAGNALPTTSWVFTTSASYSMTLTTGWNLISLPVVPTNTAASAVLGSTLNDAAKIETVWKYDPVAGTWGAYHPDNSLTSNFSTMTAGEGYWINYLPSGSGTIAGTGNLFQEGNSTPPQKTLAAGWNLIGYYQLENIINTTATKALSTVTGQWTQLRTYNNTAKQFQAVTGDDYMKPGEGYWIFMKSSSYAPYLYGPGDTD